MSAVLSAGISAALIMENYTARSASLKRNQMANDDLFMYQALEQASIAFQEGEVPVGAVLVIGDQVITSAFNKKVSTNDPTAHAELTVIREGAVQTGDWRLSNATLYVTKEPCVMCAGAMINARVGKLVYGCSDERFGAVSSQFQILFDPALNHQVKVVPGVLERECADILKRFFKARR